MRGETIMDVKKAIKWAIGIIIVAGLGLLLYNLIFQTDLVSTALSGVGQYVNEFWTTITGGHGGDIFDSNSIQSVTGSTINW